MCIYISIHTHTYMNVYLCKHVHTHMLYVFFNDAYISVSALYYFQLIFTTVLEPFSISTEVGFTLCNDLEFTLVSLFLI